MCHLPEAQAQYLLTQAIALQTKGSTSWQRLTDAQNFLLYEDIYPEDIKLEIEENIQKIDGRPEWSHIIEDQAMTVLENSGRKVPKRDAQRAAQALARAEYKCEVNPEDRLFLRKNDIPYTEPHHLIPISKYKDFESSVDIMENIVSLCSHCHNLLHYGRYEDKVPILRKLYQERVEALKACKIDLSLDKLLEYYK